ncbi:MAG: DUF1330 domain-containing protein [Deltaproteobacteria bacterium]|nr:DUF1330 domain-containing protein [Deltaproteobacteria bacterium]
MPAHIVASIRITDRTEYDKYQAGFMDIFAKYRGELLGVSGAPQVIEGAWPFTRAVLLRFPDDAEARRWYESPEYQKLSQHRWNGSTGTVIGFEGFPTTA